VDSTLDAYGNDLDALVLYFTLDKGQSTEEHIIGTVDTATSKITSVSTLNVATGEISVGGTLYGHRKGSGTVEITSFPYLTQSVRALRGLKQLSSTEIMEYDGNPAFTPGSNELGTIKYIDDTAIGGSPKATDSTYGITKLSVAAVAPAAPIAVGDNDNRVSPVDLSSVDADIVDALQGTGTPNSSNKYVTNDDTDDAGTASKVVRYDASSQIDVAAIPADATHAASKGYVDLRSKHYYTVDAITPANDTNENSIFSTTVNANDLEANGKLVIRIPLSVGTATTTGVTSTIRLKLGGSAVATGTFVSPAKGGGTGESALGYVEAHVIADGATNDQDVFIGGSLARSSFNSSTNIQPYFATIQSTTSAVDMTSNQTLEVTQQKSGAGGGTAAYGLGYVTLTN
jgi:hypothetical protein